MRGLLLSPGTVWGHTRGWAALCTAGGSVPRPCPLPASAPLPPGTGGARDRWRPAQTPGLSVRGRYSGFAFHEHILHSCVFHDEIKIVTFMCKSAAETIRVAFENGNMCTSTINSFSDSFHSQSTPLSSCVRYDLAVTKGPFLKLTKYKTLEVAGGPVRGRSQASCSAGDRVLWLSAGGSARSWDVLTSLGQ